MVVEGGGGKRDPQCSTWQKDHVVVVSHTHVWEGKGPFGDLVCFLFVCFVSDPGCLQREPVTSQECAGRLVSSDGSISLDDG